jgi:endonuclease-3
MTTSVEQLKIIIIDLLKCSGLAVGALSCCEVTDPAAAKLHRFQTLVGLMLSAQTKDPVTMKVIENLATLRGGLTPAVLANASEDIVRELIRAVSFFRTKAGRIIRVAGICDRDYDSNIPQMIDALMALPGVGLKMATLVMVQGWGDDVGIGVDVHVHRIGWGRRSIPTRPRPGCKNCSRSIGGRP